MNFVKKLAAVALLATTMLFTGCGESQIGCVDKSKVMADSPRAKKAIEEAKAEVDKIVQEFDAKYANNDDVSEEDAAKAQIELQRNLQKINQKYSAQLESRLQVVVAEIAQSKNIDVVISNTTEQKLIHLGAIDITDEVIQKMQ